MSQENVEILREWAEAWMKRDPADLGDLLGAIKGCILAVGSGIRL